MCVSSGVQKNGIEQWGKQQEFFLEKQEVEPVALLAVTGIRKAEFIHYKFGYPDHVVARRVMLMVWVIGSWERWILRNLCLISVSLSLFFLLCRS